MWISGKIFHPFHGILDNQRSVWWWTIIYAKSWRGVLCGSLRIPCQVFNSMLKGWHHINLILVHCVYLQQVLILRTSKLISWTPFLQVLPGHNLWPWHETGLCSFKYIPGVILHSWFKPALLRHSSPFPGYNLYFIEASVSMIYRFHKKF